MYIEGRDVSSILLNNLSVMCNSSKKVKNLQGPQNKGEKSNVAIYENQTHVFNVIGIFKIN